MADVSVQEMVESFGYLFLLSRRFEYITDRELEKDGLTTKQLLALIAVERLAGNAPSISQVAEILSTTHQNVKQIAQQLEKRGFVDIQRDEKDRRRLLLRVTQKNREFFDSRAQEHLKAVQRLFNSLSSREVHDFYTIVRKLIESTDDIYRTARES